MCIRDSIEAVRGTTDVDPAAEIDVVVREPRMIDAKVAMICLLYTSDAADERSSVDLGGRRIIKKKKRINTAHMPATPAQT